MESLGDVKPIPLFNHDRGDFCLEKYKCILSLRVANDLVAKDFPLVHIEPSHKRPSKLVFVFKNSGDLEKELSKYRRKERSN